MGKYFGTDGVRGIANETLTAPMAYRIGRYLGQYPNGKKNRVLLCRDTRISGSMLLHSVLAGLLASGADVYDEGISTTPSISYLVEKEHFDFGIMISASHNPFGDNGIKVFNANGEKLEDEVELLIENYMDGKKDDLPTPSLGGIGRYFDGNALKLEYVEWLSKKINCKVGGLKVLVDCANGSASYVAPLLYQKIGLDATFIHASPDGLNINKDCGSTHLESLKKEFAKGGFDLAFAFDGDGDRFMAFSPKGRLIDGDAMIYLNALAMRKKSILHENRVVLTVMSNFGLRKILDKNGIDYDIVNVGDKNVQQRLKEKHLSLGGEQSGHVIFLDELNTGDGLLSSLKLISIFVKDKAVFNRLDDFVVYPQVLANVRFKDKATLERVASSEKLAILTKEEEARLNGTGRLLVRKSGTEPLLRVMAEDLSLALCQKIVNEIAVFAEKEGE